MIVTDLYNMEIMMDKRTVWISLCVFSDIRY